MEERLGEMRKGRRERIEKGSHCFFKSSGYDKLDLKHTDLVFSTLEDTLFKNGRQVVVWDSTQKYDAIGEQNVLN